MYNRDLLYCTYAHHMYGFQQIDYELTVIFSLVSHSIWYIHSTLFFNPRPLVNRNENNRIEVNETTTGIEKCLNIHYVEKLIFSRGLKVK